MIATCPRCEQLHDPHLPRGGPRRIYCAPCRPAFELEREGRVCYGCAERKLPDAFPLSDGRHAKTDRGIQRRLRYCWACVERFGDQFLAGVSLAHLQRENGISRSTAAKLYEHYCTRHPDAPTFAQITAARKFTVTRFNSRGQMVRRCCRCDRELILKHDNFYVAKPSLPPDSPQHWDYNCKRCRAKQAAAYNKDKALARDPNFLARRREANRRWREANPQKVLESRRRYMERKKRGEVIALADRVHDPNHPRVDRQPFLDWVERTITQYPGITEFADLIGIPPRTLLRLRSRSDGGELIELDTVDRALQREGGTMLIELYPSLYEEAA